jgi:hypothetical protein
MTGRRRPLRRSATTLQLLAGSAVALYCGGELLPRAQATGFNGPRHYLGDGGRRVGESPEFYWAEEVTRLAKDFRADHKVKCYDGTLAEATADADLRDFEDAIRTGRIAPPDAARAATQHKGARAAVTPPGSETVPEEFASEFADYHRGANAYHKGAAFWDEAQRHWEALLARPEAERHYRSTWAAYMLGRLAVKRADYPAAVRLLQQTRDLAARGFADSLGLAAESYGWEAHAAWKQGQLENAATLYLTQLNAGNSTAVSSLKALIPDRTPIGSMQHFEPGEEEWNTWDEAKKTAHKDQQLEQLRAAAHQPVLRRLVTIHILAARMNSYHEERDGAEMKRSSRWLDAIRDAKLKEFQDAEYLGWVAYSAGRYDEAARWLRLSSGDTPAALWLQAKLHRRAGKLDDAVRSMAKAFEIVRANDIYGRWERDDREYEVEGFDLDEFYRPAYYRADFTFAESANGDLAGLRLARSDFIGALDVLMRAGMWPDAAFIAERILTPEELKKYLDALAGEPGGAGAPHPRDVHDLRYLLGRRLVRLERYKEAADYLPDPYDKLVERYATARAAGAKLSLPKQERARALFTAAWIARYHGMELMGTEGAPDGHITEGGFPEPDLARERLRGTYTSCVWREHDTSEKRSPVVLKASAKERQRLTRHAIEPNVRFHYRLLAASLAMQAAKLLPDNSEELADVVNRAGWWIRESDHTTANKYFDVLERRCARTEIGQVAIAARWFVADRGAWSQQEQIASDAIKPPAAPNE